MGSSNRTANVRLSQFKPDDKPTWQGDYNLDMRKIDSEFIRVDGMIDTQNNTIHTQADSVADAQSKVTALNAAVAAAQSAVAAAQAQLAALTATVDTKVNALSGAVDTKLATKANLTGATFTGAVRAPNLPQTSGSVQGKRMHWGYIGQATMTNGKCTITHALGWRPDLVFAQTAVAGTSVCTAARSVSDTEVEFFFSFVSTDALVPDGTKLAFSFLFLEN